MVRKYYKEMLLLLGLVVVLLIINLININPIETTMKSPKMAISSKVSQYTPTFSEVIKTTARTFLKRLNQ